MLLRKAASLRSEGSFKASKQRLERLHLCAPEVVEVHLEWGRLLAAQGEHERALEQYEEFAQAAPLHAGLAALKGASFMALARYELAAVELKKAIELSKKPGVQLRLDASYCLQQVHDVQGALVVLQQEPELPILKQAKVSLLVKEHRFDEAQVLLEETPSTLKWSMIRGKMWEERGNRVKAAYWFSQAFLSSRLEEDHNAAQSALLRVSKHQEAL